MSVTDAERLSRVGLTRLVEPTDRDTMALVAAVGPEIVWEAMLAGDPRVLTADIVKRTNNRHPDASQPGRDLAAGERAGLRLLCPGDRGWPQAVDRLGAARPLCLWVRGEGDPHELTAQAVAVVGSRAATGYGTRVATELAYGIAERGWTVVSGAAYGIDGAAHRGALAATAPTIAVLAGGADVPYPRGHDTLLRAIAGPGAVLSEWPPGCAPFPQRFLSRNRIIATLGAGAVVVEAAVRSGARSTAREAHEAGLPVMAVPGPVTSVMSAGCHQLIRDGAVCVTSAAEVIEVVGRIGADLAPVLRGPDDPRDALEPEPRRVLEAVPVLRGQPPARIARVAGLDLTAVRRHLGLLEVEGFVEHVDGGFRLSEDERRRRRTAQVGHEPSGA